MKHIFLNLKRFDITPEPGGVKYMSPRPSAHSPAKTPSTVTAARRCPE